MTYRIFNQTSIFVMTAILVFGFFFSVAYSKDFKTSTGTKETKQFDHYPDQSGKDALRLWNEKENQREINEAIRRYWDYWNARQPGRYSANRMWYELEQTQRWLEDPDHNPPPPPPPEPPDRFMPYPPYPYMYQPPLPPYYYWRYPRYGYPSPYHRKNRQ